MKIKVQIVIESETNNVPVVEEIACLQRDTLIPDTFGITLQEGKDLLKNLQKSMIISQSEEYLAQEKCCRKCGKENRDTSKFCNICANPLQIWVKSLKGIKFPIEKMKYLN